MNDIKTSSILILAAATLVTAACDPYPKAPGGTPAVLRVVAAGPTSLNEQNGPFADQNAIVVDDAVLDDTFNVWFNKEMDGASIQATPDTDPATGLPNADPCNVGASPLATKTGIPADAQLCYASGSAQGGGILQILPAAFWDVGAYVVGGTVRDYQGNPLTFQATFNVTHLPVLIEPDAYTIDLGWANDPTAATFTIQSLANDGTTPAANDPLWADVAGGAAVAWAEPLSTGNNSIFRITGLTPGNFYWFRVLPAGVVSARSTPAGIEMAGPPNLAVRANPLVGTGPAANTVQISLARIRGAAYRVELAPVAADGTVGAYAPVPAVGAITNPAGAALANPIPASASNPLVINVGGLTNLQAYKARITPIFGGVDGTATNESATFTINNP